tara:strand:- start:3 stop:1433 length:1431 start_codon:yes stop_codon:yes gene_type:complete
MQMGQPSAFAQELRLKELKQLNPTAYRGAVGELQSPAETQRLIDKNRTAAQAPAGGDSALDAHMQERGMQRRNPRSPIYDYVPTEAGQAPAQASGPAAVWDTNKDAEKYAPIMQQAAAQYGIDPGVLRRLLGTESSFRADAVSPRGAAYGLGVAQIASVHGMSDADRLDPTKSIPKAAEILSGYIREAGGDVRAALLRYKGASSASGVAAMAPIVDSILSGTATPATAQQAAPAGEEAPAMPGTMFSPENINNTSMQTGEELRLARAKLAEINQRLSYAPDLATAQKLRDMGNAIRFGAQNATYRDAAVRAAVGDENAMAQLASVAGVQYAQTPEGYVQATLDNTSGQYRASSQPMSREEFINNLYSVASGAASAQSKLITEQNIKTRGEMQVNAQKFGQDLRLEQLKGQQALQKLIVEARVKPAESKITISSFDGKAYVTNRNGVFVVEPGRDLGNGITAEPTLVPVGAGQAPAY